MLLDFKLQHLCFKEVLKLCHELDLAERLNDGQPSKPVNIDVFE